MQTNTIFLLHIVPKTINSYSSILYFKIFNSIFLVNMLFYNFNFMWNL